MSGDGVMSGRREFFPPRYGKPRFRSVPSRRPPVSPFLSNPFPFLSSSSPFSSSSTNPRPLSATHDQGKIRNKKIQNTSGALTTRCANHIISANVHGHGHATPSPSLSPQSSSASIGPR